MWYWKAVLLRGDAYQYVSSWFNMSIWYNVLCHQHGHMTSLILHQTCSRFVHWYEKGYHIPRRTREAATSGVDWCCVPLSQDMPSGFWWVLCTAGVAQIVVAISCVLGTRMTFGRKTHGPFWRHPKFAIDTLHNSILLLSWFPPANFQPCSSPKGPKSSSFCVIWWFHSTGLSWSFGIGAFRRGLVPRILMSCACSHRPRVYFDVEEPPICFFFLIKCMLDVDSSEDMTRNPSFSHHFGWVIVMLVVLISYFESALQLTGLCCKHTCQLTIIKSTII